MKFSFSNSGILNWSNLEAWTYSFTVEGREGLVISFMVFVNEGWDLWGVKSKYFQTLGDKIQIPQTLWE